MRGLSSHRKKNTLLTFLHTFEEARFTDTRFIKQLYVILAALAGQLLKLLDQPFRLVEFSYWPLSFQVKSNYDSNRPLRACVSVYGLRSN